jgi:primosomal protein N' (replication factor Y)
VTKVSEKSSVRVTEASAVRSQANPGLGARYPLVAVPVPLGRAFSYRVPDSWTRVPQPGQRVLCEFGRRKVMGVVLEVRSEPPADVPSEKLKPLLSILDDEPALSAELLSFLTELGDYYLAPIGEVLRLALPSVERALVGATDRRLLDDARVHAVGKLVQVAVPIAEAVPKAPLTGKAKLVFELLQETGATPIATLEQTHKSARAAVNRLVERGLVRVEQRPRQGDPFFADIARDAPPQLNEHQERATKAIIDALGRGQKAGFLLEGITGSGKTEVYLHAVAECLAQGKSAIVLVPEIALTPQLVGRFRARLGDCIAVLHSGLSEVERTRMWRRLRDGELNVAVGARSALFAPVARLGLLCVDEEHDSSFKQDEGIRYHGRDMALLRAHRADAVCVLGSATPSLLSEALALKGRLTRLVLPERAHHAASLPDVEVVDLRRTGPGPSGSRLLSVTLHRAIEQTLLDKQQSILFLNRRGYAPSLLCDDCGKALVCPNCSVALTAHRSGRQRLCCHYCDYTAFAPPVCAACGSSELSLEGAGTERIESLLASSFPNARIARLDRDVARGLQSEAILDKMRAGEIDILVGTQMVTKGHDLPEVTLVGVLNADALLSMPDYQASERTFQLLVQVAGRAGRAGKRGRVLIQTRNPDHAAIRFALAHDHAAFVRHELAQRREARYPPFVRLIMVRVDAIDEQLAKSTADRLAAWASRQLSAPAELLGPSPAPLERLKNRYRYRFLLRGSGRGPLYEVAHRIKNCDVDRRVRVHVDVDPVNML